MLVCSICREETSKTKLEGVTHCVTTLWKYHCPGGHGFTTSSKNNRPNCPVCAMQTIFTGEKIKYKGIWEKKS